MSDLSLPSNYMPTVPLAVSEDARIIKLAREIAMDIRELDEILTLHGISREEFEKLKVRPRFVQLLNAELVAWQSAVNTNERVKLKAGAVIEEWLPELYARMNDIREPLMSKVKGGELLTKLAGMGASETTEINPSDRVTITINLGEDSKLEFNKRLPPKVIEHEVLPETFEELVEESIDVANPV